MLDDPGWTNRRTFSGAQAQLKKRSKYTKKATEILPISYPMGDFSDTIGVCTDVVIRATRFAGIDLQALLQEDLLLYPEAYPNIRTPDPHIDHRRTRNLKIWLDRHALRLTDERPTADQRNWLPGDIVLMDTGVRNGTVYDQIGIVAKTRKNDIPLVINLWTIGYTIAEMDLISGDYPAVVGHYRLMHPFDYAAFLPPILK